MGGENPLIEVPFAIATGLVMALAIVCFGLLTTLAMTFISRVATSAPIVLDPRSAAFVPGLLVVGFVVVCALVAFRLSLGQRPVFQFSFDA